MECSRTACPVDCRVSYWDAWSSCSVTCGVGTQSKRRYMVVKPNFGGVACPELEASRSCDAGSCAVHCSVSPWSRWTPCTKSCGGGTQHQTRTVVQRAENGGTVCPALREERECNTDDCAIDCAVSGWSAWSTCTASCGFGTKSRSRTVTTAAAHGGKGCPLLSDEQSCNTHTCPIDCVYSDWHAWTGCSTTCGSGEQARFRFVLGKALFGGKACPVLAEKRSCNVGACPVHCDVGPWGAYSGCSLSCGGGSKSRTRKVLTREQHGGDVCPALAQTADCNTHSCPVDCIVSAWGLFGACDRSCKPDTGVLHVTRGLKKRARTVLRPADHGGKACPTLRDSASCNDHACPFNCVVSLWGSWDACSVTCGPGVHTRARLILSAARAGGGACPTLTMSGDCHAQDACPIHCSVSSWASWSACPKSCDRGIQERIRSIDTTPKFGGFACPTLFEQRACNAHRCPINCEVSSFSSWGLCTTTCGGGIKKKMRVITVDTAFGGMPCPPLEMTQACNTKPCPVDCTLHAWGAWGSCSKTCNHGTRKRARTVAQAAAHGGTACSPVLEESKQCNDRPCPEHCSVASWGLWQPCSSSCGGGTQARTRTITAHAQHGGYVCPSLSELQPCNEHACPVDCEYTAWSPWKSFTGGKALVRRTREVTRHSLFGGKACPVLVESKAWHALTSCVSHDRYGEWSKCSKRCGTGLRYRHRQHVACSHTAVVKMHMTFREGAPCNSHNCEAGQDGSEREVTVPLLTAEASP